MHPGARSSRLRRGAALVAALVLTGVSAEALEATLTAPGADEALLDDLIASSLVMRAETQGLDTAQELVAAALSDYRGLLGTLYATGRYGSVISILIDGREAANIDPLQPPAQVNRIEIRVDPGPLYRFTTAEAAPLAPGTELPETYRVGEVAPTGAIRDAASAAVSGWRDVGHAKAEVSEQDLTADHRRRAIDAKLRIAPGPELRFGPLTIEGNSKVREDAIRRIAGYPEGETFSPQALTKSGERLRRAGAFASVSVVEGQDPLPDGTLPTTISVIEQAPRRIGFGAEVSGTDGAEINGYWLHRNLFGGSERLRLEGNVRDIGGQTGIDWRLAARLDRPALWGTDYDGFVRAEAEHTDDENQLTTSAYFSFGTQRIWTDRLDGSVALGVFWEETEDALGKREFLQIGIPVEVEWDRRDFPLDPTEGFYLRSNVSPYLGLEDSDSGLRAFFDARGYLGLGADNRLVLAGRAQIGSVLGSDLIDTPSSFLFFSGGAGTVRGHTFETLGVTTPGGTVGGRGFLGLSAEVRGRVTEAASLVAFVDWGAVDADSFISSDSESHAGAGLGARYDLGGLGPLRLDVAWPVQGDTSDGVQIYIGIGQAF